MLHRDFISRHTLQVSRITTINANFQWINIDVRINFKGFRKTLSFVDPDRTDAFNNIYNAFQTAGSSHIMFCRVIQVDSYAVFVYVQRHLYTYTTLICLYPCGNTIVLKVTGLKSWITKLSDTKKEGQH